MAGYTGYKRKRSYPSYKGKKKYGSYDMAPPRKKARDYANPSTRGRSQVELKYKDIPARLQLSDTPTTVNNTLLLNQVKQDNMEDGRNGRQYTITQVGVKATIYPNIPIDRDVDVRCIVFIDKQVNATALTTPALLLKVPEEQANNSFATLHRYTLAWRDLSRSTRFQILKDQVVTIKAGSQTTMYNGQTGFPDNVNGTADITGTESNNIHAVHFDFYKSGLNLVVTCLGVDGTAGSITDNAVYAAFYVDSKPYPFGLIGADNNYGLSEFQCRPFVDVISRIRFHE